MWRRGTGPLSDMAASRRYSVGGHKRITGQFMIGEPDASIRFHVVDHPEDEAWNEVRAQLSSLLWSVTSDYFYQLLVVDTVRLSVLNQEVTQ